MPHLENNLHSLAADGKLEEFQKSCLLSSKSDAPEPQAAHSQYNVFGMNPLHCAAFHGSLEIVCFIVGRRLIPIDAPSIGKVGNGATALHYAVCASNRPIVTYLLNAGANAQIRDANGNTALQLALLHNNKKIATLLKSHLQDEATATASQENCKPIKPKKKP